MSWISNTLHQTITYWAPGAPTGFGSGKGFSAPVTFTGRWEDSNEIFFSPADQELRSESIVYAERDFEIGGFLYNGTSAATDPTTVDGAREIRQLVKFPSVDATRYLRKAYMMNTGTPLI